MKTYIYAALAFAILAALSTSHYMVYNAGKSSVIERLQNDRIEILKDGQIIDENVLIADDAALYCLLIDCTD